jgi:hypothetical protein
VLEHVGERPLRTNPSCQSAHIGLPRQCCSARGERNGWRRCGPGIARRAPVVPGWPGTGVRRWKPGGIARTKRRLVARRRSPRSLSVHCLNPRYPRTIPGTQTCRPAARKRRFAGISASCVPQIYCLPCRRSRVRIPSAASGKALHLQVFVRVIGRVVRLRSWGLRADWRWRPTGVVLRRPVFAGML